MEEKDTETLRKLYGTDAYDAVAQRFIVGPLRFELIGGNLRAISFEGIELVRGIQYLVRDRDWGTLSPDISDLSVQDEDQGLAIAFTASCIGPDGDRLTYRAQILARADCLSFTVEAEAIDDVTTSRLGFCVLHPADLAGAPLRVEHGDGRAQDSRFPKLIDPWQPFTDIKALTHRQGGLTVTCRLEGDSFEMEDQRNWSDASFKTYVRPLAKPWPYIVPAGTTERQSVTLEINGKSPHKILNPDRLSEIEIGSPIGRMPRIGLVLTPDQTLTEPGSRALLEEAGIQDLLLSIAPYAGHGLAETQALARRVEGLPQRRTLECVIAATGDLDEELQAIADHVALTGLQIDAVAIYPAPDLQSTPPGSPWPDCPPLADIYAAARRAFAGLPLGGGMYSYFTELNRKRPPLDALDFLSHATCPIVHAADDLSVMQSLEAIPHIMRSARTIAGSLPYRLGPVTIGMRQNPYGSRIMPNPDRQRIPMAMADPRQDGDFAAAWTIGYTAATEEGALDTLTLGALTGPLGVIGEVGPRPVLAAVKALAAIAGQKRFACRSTAPGKLAAVATDGLAIVANLTDEDRTARIGKAEVALPPFGVASVPLA